MALYLPDARPEHANPDPVHTAVLAWLADHPHRPVKYHDGHQWHTTEAAPGLPCALIHRTGPDDLHITADGPRHHRHPADGQRRHLPGQLADFAGGTIFRHLLDDAVSHTLAAANRATT